MMFPVPTIRNTTRLAGVCLTAVLLVSCAASKKEVRRARTSGYKADFAIVYSSVLETVRRHYPSYVENATQGVIRTAWHPIRIQHEGTTDGSSTQQQDMNQAANPIRATVGGSTLRRKRYFIRFDIYVLGGKPWRVRIDGYASEWELGAVPTVLTGANIPSWLKGRVNALYVEIYNKLARYAVRLKHSVVSSGPKRRIVAPPKPIDLKKFGRIPVAAARAVYDVLAAAKSRDFKALRKHMAAEFTWNLGATPSATAAIVTWQADSRVLERLIAVIEAGCHNAPRPQRRVLCPLDDADTTKTGNYAASFGLVAGQWKMTSFAAQD